MSVLNSDKNSWWPKYTKLKINQATGDPSAAGLGSWNLPSSPPPFPVDLLGARISVEQGGMGVGEHSSEVCTVLGVCGLEEEEWADSSQCRKIGIQNPRPAPLHCWWIIQSWTRSSNIIFHSLNQLINARGFPWVLKTLCHVPGTHVPALIELMAYWGPFCVSKMGITSALLASQGGWECGCEGYYGVFQLSFGHYPDIVGFFSWFSVRLQ